MKAGYKEALAVGTQGGFPPACSPGAPGLHAGGKPPWVPTGELALPFFEPY